MRAAEWQAMAEDLRARAETFRRLGYLASAAALEERAARHQWRADMTAAEEAERAEAGRALGLSQFSQVSRRP